MKNQPILLKTLGIAWCVSLTGCHIRSSTINTDDNAWSQWASESEFAKHRRQDERK